MSADMATRMRVKHIEGSVFAILDSSNVEIARYSTNTLHSGKSSTVADKFQTNKSITKTQKRKMKATKNAIEHARRIMYAELEKALVRWNKSHPTKARKFTEKELAEVGVKDLEFQKWLADRIINSSEYVSTSVIEKRSPKVKAMIAAENNKDAARNKQRDEIEAKYSERIKDVFNTATIAEISGQDLLEMVNAFVESVEKEVK